MKKVYLFLLVILSANVLLAQTAPTPAQTLPYSQNFGTTTFTAMPAGWVAWNGMNGGTVNTQALAEASIPTGNATIATATGATTTGGVHGLANGAPSNARPYIQTSGSAPNGANQIALAINTTGLTTIVVVYDVESIVANLRTVGVVMQYRVGTTGAWTTVTGTGNPYSQSAGTTGIKVNASVILPAAAENQAVVQLRWATWRGTEAGNSSGLAVDNINISGTSAGTANIALSSANPAVPAGNILQGINNNIIYAFDLAVTTNSATLNGLTINTAGNYAVSDVTNFKAWYSADNSFNAGSDVLLGSEIALAAGSQTFSPFSNQAINSGNTGYIFITADIPCTAAAGNTLSVDAITTADISFVSGNKSGTAFAGGTQTIATGTPINVTGAAASTGNNESVVSWTNPLGCYDEIMIVAAAGSANSGTPAGDGTAYTANLTFGSGTALGNGFVIYKGTTSPQTVTGLSNGTQYYFKIFTRQGSVWSSGVEVTATPANVTTATDYFRSKATGDYNALATWESSPDASAWISATMLPGISANTITIRNGHTVTINIATTLDQVVIASGGILTNTAGIITLNDEATTPDDLIIQNGGILILAVNSGAPIGGGTLRTQTGAVLRVSGTGTLSNLQTSRFVYENNAVLEYTSTSSFTASGTTYFPNANATTIPVLRTTANIGTNIGGGGITMINGIFEANGTANFAGTGAKVFRNGIRGTGNVGQGTAGAFIISGTAELGGTGVITLGANGMQIASTSTTTLVLYKTIDGGTVTVDGSLYGPDYFTQLRGTTNIIINGTLNSEHLDGISITGTLANTGTKILGPASTVVFGCNATQQFTTGFNYVNVTINAQGNGFPKILNGPATITGALNFIGGTISTSATNLLTLDVNAVVTGASQFNYVSGPLQRNTNSTSAYTFPIGEFLFYRPFDIIPASAAPTSFIADYSRPAVSTNTPPCTPARLQAYTANESWNVIRSAGTADAAIRLNYVQSESNGQWTNGPSAAANPDNTKAITVAQYLSGSSCWEVYPNVTTLVLGDAASGQPATSARSVFGDFTFGYGDFAALPITINYLRGAKQGGNHNLSWMINCVGSPTAAMSLERSADARNFRSIYSLTATAERCLQSFVFTDGDPLAGINYYRLRMTDADGKNAYSQTVAILNKDKGFELVSISPNPAPSDAILSITSANAGKMDMVITNASGKIVGRQAVAFTAGSNLIPLKIQHLAAGTYQLTGTMAGSEMKTIRFVKN